MCQPIDGGIGAVIKKLLQDEQDVWLDEPGNIDAWEGDANAPFPLTASARRVLITKWVGSAWATLTMSTQYKDTFRKCFERTGALITADGSGDELIRPMKGYPYTIPAIVVDAAAAEVVDAQGEDLVVLEAQEALAADPDMDTGDEDLGEDVVLFDGPEGVQDDDEVTIVDKQDAPIVEENAETESWRMAVSAALRLDNLRPLSVDVALPKRVLLKNSYVLVLLEGEWELVKIHNGFGDDKYHFWVISTEEWDSAVMTKDSHGRLTESCHNKWVYLSANKIFVSQMISRF
jgi:hypothetical protein